MLLDIFLGNSYLDMIQKAQMTKAKREEWDFFKLKIFCRGKKIINN
jgi:hypothetical protein